MPIFLIGTVLLTIFLTYRLNRVSKLRKNLTDQFWSRENEANHARNHDISHLPLLIVDPSQLPTFNGSNPSILSTLQQVNTLSCESMIDLSAYTNTDLKLMYGVGNYKLLSEYDNNYTNYMRALSNLATLFFKNNLLEEAKNTCLLIFQYGATSCNIYELLGKTYLALDQPQKVSELIAQVESSELSNKKSIFITLKNILASYQ